MKSKIFADAAAAVADVLDGATVMVGGFGSFGGLPINLIVALAERGAGDLTVIANMGGVGFELSKRIKPGGYQDLGLLFEKRLVRKFIGSVPALGGMPPSTLEKQYGEGNVEIEFVPQGTLAERIRCGAGGLGGFYTPVGVGTVVEKGYRRPGISPGAAAQGGLRPDQGAPGGYPGESCLPADGPLLQSGHGPGGRGYHRRGR
jgi:3-oxoacid CoA-transferase A subunit